MDELNTLRVCAVLHDIGKPECLANRKPWYQRIYCTPKIVAETLGEEYAVTAMRHQTGPSYSVEDHLQTELERILCLADDLASGAGGAEESEPGVPLQKTL